jgi:hypothetical protein
MGAKDTKVTKLQVKTAAGTDITLYEPAPNISGEWLLKSATFMPCATSAANATNYVTLALLQGAVGIATSLTTATVALTAGTERAFTMLTTAAAMAAREFGGSTDYVKLTVTAAASGVLVDAILVLEWEQVS